MSHHPPFKQLEASRPAFPAATEKWNVTQIPSPEWVVGSGANKVDGLAGTAEGRWSADAKVKEIVPEEKDAGSMYKMMISAITPRPIGFISSVSKDGVTNLAPFSYFNMANHDPPIVLVSFTHPKPTADGTSLKETCQNILDTKQFTANIISESFVEAANFTSIDAPLDVSEWALSGLTPVASKSIKPARVGESAFSMECELEHFYHMKNDKGLVTGTTVFGRVKLFHVKEDIIDDSLLVDTAKLQPVSRLGGITYARTTTAYETPRPVWDQLKDTDAVKKALEEGKWKAKA